MKTIKEILALPEGTPVDSVQARITSVEEYSSGVSGGVQFSLQTIELADATGTMPARVSSQSEFKAEAVGQTINFAAQVKNGKLYGIKVGIESGKHLLVISKTAVISLATTTDPEPEPEPEEVTAATPEPPKQKAVAPTPSAPAKATGIEPIEVFYERTFNTGNYTSQKIGIRLVLNGEKATVGLQKAMDFVTKNGPKEVV